MASTISGNSGEPRNDAGIDDLKRKLAEIDTHRDNYEKQQQKVEEYVSTLTESMHKMATDIINIRKDMNGLSSQVKEITELLKQQIEIKTSANNFIKSPPRQRRRTGNTGSGSQYRQMMILNGRGEGIVILRCKTPEESWFTIRT
jgi:prophage DNA circulation protein